MTLLLAALVVIIVAGFAACTLSRWSSLSSAVAASGVFVGAVLGEVHAIGVLSGLSGGSLTLPWAIPYGPLRIAVDPLSAFFLVPLFGLTALAAVYGGEYLLAFRAKKALGPAWLAFNVLVASMVVVVVARQAVLFLIAWEVMSLAAYVCVTFEHDQPEVRRAGWVYLIATHVGTAFLVALFLVFGAHAKSFDFDVMRAAAPAVVGPGAGLSALLFAFAVVGFGVKAGFVPLHVWLPEAHAAAPSHVSAVMSGVLIKMGIYGLLRILLLLGGPAPWWGPVLMVVGVAGALLGISLALVQRDMKRVLAYSSIENVGLITLGLGTGFWGLASGQPLVAMLGLSGGLLHVWNHAAIKGLLFLGAGSVLHGCGTKDLERLGGLMKRMPRTGSLVLLGAVAISALPPMNAFVSEWLVYLGLVEGGLGGGGAGAVFALLLVGVVSFIGGLAVLCFVRLVGVALLGEPRSEQARHAHESPLSMTLPMAALAAVSVAASLAPRALLQTIAGVTAELGAHAPAPDGEWMAPISTVGTLDAVLWLSLLFGGVAWWILGSRRAVASDATWGCGYGGQAPRAQYTALSFAQLVSERILPKRFHPRTSVRPPAALFPGPASLSSEYGDPVTRDFYEPFLAHWGDRFARLRWVQQGMLHMYLAYVLVAALAALAWTSLRAWFGS